MKEKHDYCDDHSSLTSTTAVQIWIISFILHIPIEIIQYFSGLFPLMFTQPTLRRFLSRPLAILVISFLSHIFFSFLICFSFWIIFLHSYLKLFYKPKLQRRIFCANEMKWEIIQQNCLYQSKFLVFSITA